MAGHSRKPPRRPEASSELPGKRTFGGGLPYPITADEYAEWALERAAADSRQTQSRQPGHDHRRFDDHSQHAPLPEPQVHGRGWQLDRLRKVLRTVFPP